MKPIPARAPIERIEAELTEEKFMRKTNKNDNEIYIFTHHDSPYLMEEIGRAREITFRNAGGGTGKPLDIDRWDIDEKPYKQLIVWEPREKQILGGYRFYDCRIAPRDENGDLDIATTRLYQFSDEFLKNHLHRTIELGRSFVVPEYQATNSSRKSLFTLDNLWDGLGALIVDYPEMDFFIGKVTMYTHTPQRMRDLMHNFFNLYFPNKYAWAKPIKEKKVNYNDPEIRALFSGDNYKEDHKTLSREIRKVNATIPPLINAYMNLTPTMQTFGAATNEIFGDVEETGILMPIKDIYNSKKERHVGSYVPNPKRKYHLINETQNDQ